MYHTVAFSQITPVIINGDDGTEINESTWQENGIVDFDNYLGTYRHKQLRLGFRYHLNNLEQGIPITYARLRFASTGGSITSGLKLTVEGVLQDSPTGFSQTDRPSCKYPRTLNSIGWQIYDKWAPGIDEVPLYYSSPDISPIINEILLLPNWGKGPERKTLVLTIKDYSESIEENYVQFRDFKHGSVSTKCPVQLEIYPSVYDTFLGKELIGRVEDDFATINIFSLIDTDTYIEYGTSPGEYSQATKTYYHNPAEIPIEMHLEYLQPDTRYFYRLAYRKAGSGEFQKGEESNFHTQRPKGSNFSFAIIADEHVQNMHKLPNKPDHIKLFQQTLANIADTKPDYFISLGDFANTELTTARNAENFIEARERYLLLRHYIDDIAHSIPFYLVTGNHEGEQGWHYSPGGDSRNNLAVISLDARRDVIPNPVPNSFYSGNTECIPEGLKEDYFAWTWGDAHFIALSPYWYTKIKPKESKDGWDWTLGKKQYDWLYETLHGSDAKWKFVFIHHLTSTVVNDLSNQSYYGRGGIEIAKYKVDNRPSFEWGGEDEAGNYVFLSKRPGWTHGAIHDMLVQADVDIVFHGHDHVFAKQDLDGIVYQECPQPGQPKYTYGFQSQGKYKSGDIFPNSGHVQITVDPGYVRVEYIRAYLPGDGDNGEVAFGYMLY